VVINLFSCDLHRYAVLTNPQFSTGVISFLASTLFCPSFLLPGDGFSTSSFHHQAPPILLYWPSGLTPPFHEFSLHGFGCHGAILLSFGIGFPFSPVPVGFVMGLFFMYLHWLASHLLLEEHQTQIGTFLNDPHLPSPLPLIVLLACFSPRFFVLPWSGFQDCLFCAFYLIILLFFDTSNWFECLGLCLTAFLITTSSRPSPSRI